VNCAGMFFFLAIFSEKNLKVLGNCQNSSKMTLLKESVAGFSYFILYPESSLIV
jgi:hypothetical protein